MIRNHPATLVVLLWFGKAMAQEHSTVGPVAEPAAIQPTPPTWRCIPNTDDGCLLTLVTGEMVLGFPVRVIPNVQVTIRLLSGVRRIYEWNRIKEGTPIPAAQLPIERSMITYPKVPVSSRPDRKMQAPSSDQAPMHRAKGVLPHTQLHRPTRAAMNRELHPFRS
ncbi:MAG: hypothetical protein U0787_04850 [Polyangia bacterium]